MKIFYLLPKSHPFILLTYKWQSLIVIIQKAVDCIYKICKNYDSFNIFESRIFINTSAFANGIYILKLNSDKKQWLGGL